MNLKKLNINIMKRKIIDSFLGLLIMLLISANSYSQTVELISSNLQIVTANSLTFDFYVKNTSASDWTYSGGQYKWTFNNAILNSGTLTWSMVPGSSEFTGGLPGSVITGGTAPNLYLRTTAPTPGANFIIPANTSKRFGTFKIQTSAAAFVNVNPIIILSTLAPQTTAIYFWNGATQTQITGTNRTITDIPDAPLPVQLASFTGNVLNKRDIKLTWKTSQEFNNHGFDVERKAASGQWSKVAFVNGKGNSNVTVTYNYEDLKLNTGKYSYRLKQIDNNGNFEYFELNTSIEVGVPTKFDISQNYPNPFNPTTKIDFDLPYDSKVNIVLYDISGREVKTLVNETRTAGYHTLQFNASDLSSGTYFYRIMTKSAGADFVTTKKMMLVK
jgi:hypothetical protein